MFQVGTTISPIIHTICKWMSCPLNCSFLFQSWYVINHHTYQLYFQGIFKYIHVLCSLNTSILQFRSVQLLSHVWLFVTPRTATYQASLSIANSWSLLKLMSIKSVMPSNHLILCCSFLLLLSIISSIRVFSNDSVHPMGWPEYWSFSFSISPSNGYSRLISFRIDCFDLLTVQGTLKSLLHRHYIYI